MDWYYLSPFSITVLEVALLLGLLLYFLGRMPERSAATRSLMAFLGGVAVVFLTFFVIFSSVDPVVTTRAWWALHAFVFPAVAMVQFAYLFPEDPFPEERRKAYWACLVPAVIVYPIYLWHTLGLVPQFSFPGFLYVYLETAEIGVVIGLEIAWILWVFYRKARRWESETRGRPAGLGDVLRAEDRRTQLLRNLMIIFTSPLVLCVAIIMAYLGHLSWGLVGHLLGSGLMVAAFLFAVLYINNCPEPSTFMLKLLGLSLGTVLIVFGLGGSVGLGIQQRAFDDLGKLRVEQVLQALEAGTAATAPAEAAYVVEWPGGRGPPSVHRAPPGRAAAMVEWARPTTVVAGRRGYRALDPLVAESYYVTYRGRRGDAIVEVGIPYLAYRQGLHVICRRLLWTMLGTVVLVILVFPSFFRRTLLRPMEALLAGVRAVNDGDRDARVPVRVQDEIGYLSRSFNDMVGSVQDAEKKLQDSLDYQIELTDAYSCFFPREFMRYLEKECVTEIELGDNIELEMTVLFSDIRSFTDISEKMTPEENFRFINEYLGRVGPIVRDRGGFIDKYIGDAVMALFPRCPDDAVEAAIGMQDAVQRYNEELREGGRDPIAIGIGIHTGRLRLGTIGEAQRMEGTVISDAVNLASRVEGLTKMYGASIVVSQEVRAGLADPARFEGRRLDRVQVKGKQEAVELHEVFDAVDVERTRRRVEARERFEGAFDTYAAGSFAEARAAFEELLEEDPEDKAAALYVERCRSFEAAEAPEGWDGVTKLYSK